MPAKKASEHFPGEEGYNCAQAVLKAFQTEYTVTQEMIDAYAAHGGGRAEGGLCGALYAAQALLNNLEETEALKEQFIAKAGSFKCEEILDLNKLTCPDCIDLAAQIVDGEEH